VASLACLGVPRLALAAALILTALATGACVTARTELTITEDGLVEGFAEAIVPRDELEAQGIDPDDALQRLDLTDFLSTAGVAEGNRIEMALPRGDDVIVTVRFLDVDADAIGVLGGPPLLSIAEDGSMTVDNVVDMSRLGDTAVLDIAIQFPFEVVEHDGQLEGSTVRWHLEPGEGARRLSARTNDEPYMSSPASVGWLAVGAAIVTALVLLGGFVLWRWSRHSERRASQG
jgi:hypothetical protein